jgi:hypothetical protein
MQNDSTKKNDFPPRLQRNIIIIIVAVFLLSIFYSIYDVDKKNIDEKEANDSGIIEGENNGYIFTEEDSIALEGLKNINLELQNLNVVAKDGDYTSIILATNTFKEGWSLINKASLSRIKKHIDYSDTIKPLLEIYQNQFLKNWRYKYYENLKQGYNNNFYDVLYENNELKIIGIFYQKKEISDLINELENVCRLGRFNKIVVKNMLTDLPETLELFNGKDTDPY